MAQPAPLYDLVLLLDSEATEDQRTKVLNDVERIVTADGEIVSDQDWGLRALAYEIRHKPHAAYHLLQFHAPREVLETLQRTLSIMDGVLRPRIIKLAPGTPPAPDPPRPGAPAEPVGA